MAGQVSAARTRARSQARRSSIAAVSLSPGNTNNSHTELPTSPQNALPIASLRFEPFAAAFGSFDANDSATTDPAVVPPTATPTTVPRNTTTQMPLPTPPALYAQQDAPMLQLPQEAALGTVVTQQQLYQAQAAKRVARDAKENQPVNTSLAYTKVQMEWRDFCNYWKYLENHSIAPHHIPAFVTEEAAFSFLFYCAHRNKRTSAIRHHHFDIRDFKQVMIDHPVDVETMYQDPTREYPGISVMEQARAALADLGNHQIVSTILLLTLFVNAFGVLLSHSVAFTIAPTAST
jgi:hypothetical protein